MCFQVVIGVSNAMQRLSILRAHSKSLNLSDDVDLAHVAELTLGYVGADIASLCREAACVTLRRIINQSNDKDQDSLSVEKTLKNNEGNCNQTVADLDLELKGGRGGAGFVLLAQQIFFLSHFSKVNGVGSGGTLPQIERGLDPQAPPLDPPLFHSGSRSVDSSLNRGHRVVFFSKTPYSHMIVSLQLTELSLVGGRGGGEGSKI